MVADKKIQNRKLNDSVIVDSQSKIVFTFHEDERDHFRWMRLQGIFASLENT